MSEKDPFAKNLLLLQENLLKPLEHNPIDFKNQGFTIKNGCLFSSKRKEKVDESIDLPEELEANVLCVYGLGLGKNFEKIEPWLMRDSTRFLVFLEDDEAALCLFLEQEASLNLLKNPQVLVYFLEKQSALCDELSELNWFCAKKNIFIDAVCDYKTQKSKVFEEICYILRSRKERIEGILREGLDYAQIFSNNFYRNCLISPKSACASKLFGQYRNVPAIVCGSGPSLEKQIPLLKEYQNQALIIAAGSAITALSTHGITPHLSSAFGPSLLQERVMLKHQAFQTPLIYQNRLNYRVSWAAQNPLLLLNKPESYPLADWLGEILQIQEEGTTLGGVSISNFCASLAKDLGCNPIIFIGCDMAFTEQKVYSSGVLTKGQKDAYSKVTRIETKDIYGEPVESNYHWLTESEWFADLKTAHPNITFYNASEGGIGMPGIENIALKDCKKLFKLDIDLSGRIHADLKQAKFDLPLEKILSELSKLYDSLEKCIECCDEILEETLMNVVRIENGQESYDSPKSIALKEQMQQEIAYQYILSPLEEIFGLSKKQSLYQIKRQSKENPLKSLLEFILLRTESLVFTKRAAEAHQEMIEEALEEFEAIKEEKIDAFFEHK